MHRQITEFFVPIAQPIAAAQDRLMFNLWAATLMLNSARFRPFK
jgi:hypothetical protein